MLNDHHRARLPLNLNATSVTSFIIAKISWHLRYRKRRKFAIANFVSIACVPLLMHQVNALLVNARSARQSTIRCFICPQPRTHRLTILIRMLHLAISPLSVLATHASFNSGSFNSEQIMLSTVSAVVLVCDGSRRACRALLDCRSQANFVSKKFVEALGLETRPLNVSISGVNGTVTSFTVRIKLQLRLVHRGYQMHRN